ncbi:hypothetical protein D9Q98_006975 [Chlorella vulgaris]|uniref:Uncharacterized protein n=1 Tax=Chlorella vulgaris TaxID=3077 RepID=A0A9D4TJE2_CHLVU|nr:hypothetical protein D9Q98_006975 [Chlorella vulgaris]
MGNTHAPPSREFVAEFYRTEAAIAAEEAKFELQRNAESLRQLHLRLIDMKIACTKYWCRETHLLVAQHEDAAEMGCCLNVSLECHRAAAWRRTQNRFYHRLLALLEEEKSALQQRCPAMEVSLPTLEATPEPLPVGDSICSTCTFLLTRIRWEPQLRSGQDGSVQDFKWMPRSGYQMSNHLGPGTPSAGQEATRQPFTGTNRTGDTTQVVHPIAKDAANLPGMAEEVLAACADIGGQEQTAASLEASAGALSASNAGADAGANSPSTIAEN